MKCRRTGRLLVQARGKFALENGEKVVYAKCRIGKQRRLDVLVTENNED
jgi:hypothetical protein